MSPVPLMRNEPTDSDPAVVRAAASLGTRPEFVGRPGFLLCPLCAQVWPLRHYRYEHVIENPRGVRAQCRTCRARRNRNQRQRAIETGICEALGCDEPILDRYQCGLHLALSDAAADARRAAKLARAAAASNPSAALESLPD